MLSALVTSSSGIRPAAWPSARPAGSPITLAPCCVVARQHHHTRLEEEFQNLQDKVNETSSTGRQDAHSGRANGLDLMLKTKLGSAGSHLHLGPSTDPIDVLQGLRSSLAASGTCLLTFPNKDSCLQDAMDLLLLLSEEVVQQNMLTVFQPLDITTRGPGAQAPESQSTGEGPVPLTLGMLVSRVRAHQRQALLKQPPCQMLFKVNSRSDPWAIASKVVDAMEKQGCVKLLCQHHGKAFSSVFRGLKKARKIIQLHNIGDIFVVPHMVLDRDYDGVEVARLYLNVWRRTNSSSGH